MPSETSTAIRVLLVEDSAAMRELLTYILNSDQAIEIVATAGDGEQAVLLAQRFKPDVVLMDIHLPKLDGFAATRRIMETSPTRIVMITATAIPQEVASTFQALESGALTVLAKPPGLMHRDHRRLADELLQTLRLMSEVHVVRRWSHHGNAPAKNKQLPANLIVRDIRVIAIGASTGGPLALKEILSGLPEQLDVPILIVQHISTGFTEGFIEWLAQSSGYDVRLAKQGELADAGVAYVAPDGFHMTVDADGTIVLQTNPPENGMRPSVSALFRSVAESFGATAIGILLTGMGRDGAQELKLMQSKGSPTIAQDEMTSVVYGMPGEAIKLGAANYVLSPENIALVILALVNKKRP